MPAIRDHEQSAACGVLTASDRTAPRDDVSQVPVDCSKEKRAFKDQMKRIRIDPILKPHP